MAAAKPLIVIVGPTASGKSAAAMEIAKALDGEIICADSRTVYKGMDIGTAKPSEQDQAVVPHHLIDVCEPDKTFTAAEFKRMAEQAIETIRTRGKLPILVGGSGLYVDSVLFNYQFNNKPDPELRARLESLAVEDLQNYCQKQNIELPKNSRNKRHLVRAIEQKGINQQRRREPIDNCIVVGIATDKETLRQRIRDRAAAMIEGGAKHEAARLGERYGWEIEPLKKGIYAIMRSLINNDITNEQAINLLEKSDFALAKKQRTWFRRNKFVHWFNDSSELENWVLNTLGAK